MPLIGDFHYNGHQLLERASRPAPKRWPSTASTRATWVSASQEATPSSRQIIEFALRYGKPVRIGANWGSLDQSMLAAQLMDENAQRAEPWDAGARGCARR